MKKRIFTITVIIFAFLANVSAQLRVDSTGRVGIGAINPLYKLNVNGDARINGNIYLGNTLNDNVFLGYGVLSSNTTGNSNTAIGNRALFSNTTGSSNTANGERALYHNTTGTHNTANGVSALYSNTEGNYNTANEVSALHSNTTGNFNTVNGASALYYNTTGNFNTVNGASALYYNTTGGGNTVNGEDALYYNTTGNCNTANGNAALYNNITGNYNTAIGFRADVNTASLNNATAIGSYARVTSNNQVRIGDTYVNDIGGYVGWSNISDKRTKKNIRTDVPGLTFINRLQPVTFNLDLDAIDDLLKIDKTKRQSEDELSQELKDINKKARESKEKKIQTGFIAQDVEEIAKSIGYDFSGVNVDEIGIYGLRYAEFVVPLVKAVQELSAQNNQLQKQIGELSSIVRQLSEKAGNANDFNSK